MLEGYKPIDLSSVFPPMELGQMRNRVGLSQAAMNILATSEWKATPISTLLASGLNSQGEAPKRKQTLWGRTVDLLSTPTYAVANAVDDALAGHQSSDTDNVVEDIGQIIGGYATGAARGAATGLRGAFAPSEIAADPQDKQYLGDALVRFDTHMSAEDAMKPENFEKVRERLKNKKINQLSDSDENKYFYDFEKGVVEVTDEDVKQYFKDMNLYGLGASIVADPLNFVTGGSKVASLTKGNKGASEIPEIISGSKNTYDGFKLPVKPGKVNTGPLATGSTKKPGSYKVIIPPSAVQNKVANPATGELITPPDWFKFPTSAAAMGDVTRTTQTVPSPVAANVTDELDEIINPMATGATGKADRPITGKPDGIFPVARVPDKQLRAAERFSDPKEIGKLTSDLVKRIAGEGSANAIERLTVRHPGIQFPQTSQLIERLGKLPDIAHRLGSQSERKKIIGAFHRTIRADSDAMKVAPKVKSAENIINDSDMAIQAKLVDGARPRPPVSKNPTRDAGVANDVYQKFSSQVLGSARPAGIRNPAAYDASVAAGRTARYSGSQQVQMWNHITHTIKNVKTPNRFAVANNILRQVEDMFIARKANPMSGFRVKDSVPLRLSQVLDAIGPAAAAISPTLLTKILRGEADAIAQLPAPVIQKIEELKAGEALVDASNVVKGVDAGSKSIDDLIKGPLSAAREEEIITIGSRVASDIARTAGGSPVAGAKAAAITKAEYLPKNPIDAAIKSKNLNTMALISHPNVSGALLKKYSSAPDVARAINKSIGGPSPRQLGNMVGPAAKAVDWIGARFNAAYKNADMRPTYLKEAASAKATVAKRAEYLNNLAKQYNVNDADLWSDALKGAQGRIGPVPGTPSAALSQEILQVMENLFGSSGLKTGIALENSVAGRSQLYMKELNANLHRFGLGQYQFGKGPKPKKGEPKSPYADGPNWLNSWETWEIDRPLDFLFKIQNVVEHTVREKIMFDEIIARFGSSKRIGEFSHTVDSHPRLAGTYFGKEAASQVTQFVKNLKEISKPSSKQLQNFDKVLSKWKAGVTIYVPSHHIRNMIGDTYFNWMAGVNSARPYGTALKIMRSQKGRYEGIDEISALTNPDALRRLMAGGGVPGPAGKQTALTMKNGTNVTNDMVYVSAFQQGILPTTRVLEDIPDDVATAFERFKPLGGRGQKVAHTISEGRDHYIRLAHYVDALKKSSKPFEQAVVDAASVVRKWHPDGMDLTAFEKNVMRRVFPFYSWTRKALPLIVESMVATPGKVMAIPKAQYFMQQAMGIQTGPMSDPFPYDQLFPDWIREKGIGPIASPESGLTSLLGGDAGYSVINPGNPTMDTISQLSDPGKMGMGMLNPAARIPIELATGREAQTGAPFGGITDTDYLAKQIPGVSHAGRATGEFGVSDTVKETSQGYNMQNIINLLTALGAHNTGPDKKSAEFDLREYLRGVSGR